MVCTIHSEVNMLEEQLTPEIKKYIAISDWTKKYIVDDFNVDSNLVEVVLQPHR
jgi:hypothetical protein